MSWQFIVKLFITNAVLISIMSLLEFLQESFTLSIVTRISLRKTWRVKRCLQHLSAQFQQAP